MLINNIYAIPHIVSNFAHVFISAIHQWCHALHHTDPDEWQQQWWGEWPHHCPWLPKSCADITMHEPHSCDGSWRLRHVTGTTHCPQTDQQCFILPECTLRLLYAKLPMKWSFCIRKKTNGRDDVQYDAKGTRFVMFIYTHTHTQKKTLCWCHASLTKLFTSVYKCAIYLIYTTVHYNIISHLISIREIWSREICDVLHKL